MSIESMMPSNHLILCHPLLLLPSIFSSIRIFSKELAFHIRWPKYWSFSTHPSNEYSELISFRMDWFDLLAIQGTLKHHNSSPTPQFKNINRNKMHNKCNALESSQSHSPSHLWKNHIPWNQSLVPKVWGPQV